MKNRPCTHVLFWGGETMLCCTMDNQTNQVVTYRKPTGTRIIPGAGAIGSGGVVGLQSRGVEGREPIGKEAPVPVELTPDMVKSVRKTGSPK